MLTALRKFRTRQLSGVVEQLLSDRESACSCPACGRPLIHEHEECGGMVYCSGCNTAISYCPSGIRAALPSRPI